MDFIRKNIISPSDKIMILKKLKILVLKAQLNNRMDSNKNSHSNFLKTYMA